MKVYTPKNENPLENLKLTLFEKLATKEDIGEVNKQTKEVKTKVQETTKDVKVLKEDVTVLRKDVKVLKKDSNNFKESFAHLFSLICDFRDELNKKIDKTFGILQKDIQQLKDCYIEIRKELDTEHVIRAAQIEENRKDIQLIKTHLNLPDKNKDLLLNDQ